MCSLPRCQSGLVGEAFETLLPDLHPASIHPRTGHALEGHGSLRDKLAPVAGKPSGKPREIYGKFTVNLREISGKLPGDPMDYPSDPLYTSNHKMVSSLKGYVLKITEKPYPGRPFRNILDAETIYGKFTVNLR